MQEKIWLSSPHMGGNEMKYVNEAYNTNWIAPLGPNVNGFEDDIKSYLKINDAAALSSGTGAIHLALTLLGVEAGDEVLASTFTFSATINPITYLGAKPILIDSELDTWNMSPALLEEAIIDRISNKKKPKAIILVHLYGMPAKMDEIIKIAEQYDIPIIEDAAEALGASYKGKALGTFGAFGILSFNGNKIITTSGGGALVSDDSTQIEKARFLSTQARDDAPHYQHSQIGFNYRMSNIVAGIGRGQMEVINQRVNERRSNHSFYKEIFQSIEGVNLHQEPNSDYYSNFWLTAITIDRENKDREGLRLALEKHNIEARPLWKPMHSQPIFKSCRSFINGNSDNLFNIGLCLPSGSNLSIDEKNRIKDAIVNYFS